MATQTICIAHPPLFYIAATLCYYLCSHFNNSSYMYTTIQKFGVT
jgi:hypothetical protein